MQAQSLSPLPLLHQLETANARHRAAVAQNQQLSQQNEQLYQSMEGHLQEDWDQLNRNKDQLQTTHTHYQALQRIKEQLTHSLSALERPSQTAAQILRDLQHDEHPRTPHFQQLRTQHNTLLDHLNQLKRAPPAQHELPSALAHFQTSIGGFFKNMQHLNEDHQDQNSELKRCQEQVATLEEELAETREEYKVIYNELLEATLQLQNAERLRPQLQLAEQQRDRLRQALQSFQTHPPPSKNIDLQQNQLFQKPRSESSPQSGKKVERKKVKTEVSPDLTMHDGDDQTYGQLRKCYQQIAALKLRISQTEASDKSYQITSQSEKAQLELQHLLTKKRLEESERQVGELKLRIERAEKEIALQVNEQRQLMQCQEEIYLLKLKVFALQSLEVSHKYKLSRHEDNEAFLQKIRPLCARNEHWKLQALQMMAETHSTVKQLERKLEEEIQETRLLQNKCRNYKVKIREQIKNKQLMEQEILQSFKSKQAEYDKIIQKMHGQIEKAYKMTESTSVKEMAQMLTAPLHHKLQLITTENSFLRSQLARRHPLMAQEAHKQQLQVKQLQQQIDKLTKENNALVRSNRQSQSMLLEQNLTLAVSKVQPANATKRSQFGLQKSQVMALEQQVTLLNSRLQEQSDLLSKETVKYQQLSAQFAAQKHRLQQAQAQISVLKKQDRLTSRQQQGRSSEFWNRQTEETPIMRQQLMQLKGELARQQQFGADVAQRAETFLQESRQYCKRIEELEGLIRVIDHQSNDKNHQIMRLTKQNQLLEKQLQKMEEQIQLLQNNGSSLKDIEWVQAKKQLQAQTKKLRQENEEALELLNRKERQLESVRRECDIFEEENLKLHLNIKENHIELKQNTLHIQKQQERNSKLKQLELNNFHLDQENKDLRSQIDKLKNRLTQSYNRPASPNANNGSQLFYLREALSKAENDLRQNRSQIERINTLRLQEKQTFQHELDKRTVECEALSKQLDFYRKGGAAAFMGKGSAVSKGGTISDRQPSEGLEGREDLIKSEIIDLMEELQIKNQQIRGYHEELAHARRQIQTLEEKLTQADADTMKNKYAYHQKFIDNAGSSSNKETISIAVGPDEEEEDRTDVYLRQLFDLRAENQKLRENKLHIEDKIRRIQQDYSALRIQMISGGSYIPPVSDKPISSEYSRAFPRPIGLQRFSLNTSGFSNPIRFSNPQPSRDDFSLSEENKSNHSPGSRVSNTTSQKELTDEQKRQLGNLAPLVESVRSSQFD